MPSYQYIAENSRGVRLAGVYEDVADAAHLEADLRKLGCRLLEAKPVERKEGGGGKRKIRPTEIVAFAYEFSGMFAAGLTVVRCLETLEEQASNEDLKSILNSVRRSIEAGASVASAFEPYRGVFGDFFLGMLEAGQTGGKLAETLRKAAEYYEKQLEVKTKVKGAFLYPAVVGLLCVCILTAIVIFVIPVFQRLYQQLHIELPWPTQILIGLSELFRHYFWIFPLLTGVVYWGWKRWRNHPGLRAVWDEAVLKLPTVGPLLEMMLVSRYIRTFAMMSSAGVGIVQALQQARQVCRNSVLNRIGEQIEQEIMTGGSLAQLLAEHPIFPPVIVQLAHAGEEAGLTAEMLTKGADYLDSAVQRRTAALLVKLEPMLSVIMGAAVGLILLGVYLPMFDYMSHIK
ncbi:MAG TPA: type II secretion system F family protein [Anaerohalosphaeraceae bacterium]|nr:type II secretion system F family protein [Anaerohalosphaeraceae bacterium]HOL88448.1 type II secretion system F family protein [Anaerohalosphaeraceae bacterium]HPP56975.1 type II secretion system F family protein [Anaerohalosphaeraceae bacterium]